MLTDRRIKISRINGTVGFHDATLWEATRFPNHGSNCEWIVDIGLLVNMWNSVGHLFTPSEAKRIYSGYAFYVKTGCCFKGSSCLTQTAINKMNRAISVDSWTCGNCDAAGCGSELLFDCEGDCRCPECCSADIVGGSV